MQVSNCSEELAACLSTCNGTNQPTSQPTTDPCSNYVLEYDLGLHIGSIFIIAATSFLGVTAPLYIRHLAQANEMSGYWILCGKLMGTGVVLACGLVHMLQPAAVSLSSPCVPWEFSTDYNAYAFLFAMLAMIIMHFMENLLRVEHFTQDKSASREQVDFPGAMKQLDEPEDKGFVHYQYYRRQIQTYAMEFGLTVHSIFVGLLVGVTGDVVLNGTFGFQILLVALGFHQFFEGLALGARLADTNLSNKFIALFVVVFMFSCPLGIVCGILYVSSVNPNGITMLLVQGTFDGVCSGLLLYVGTQLMHVDFPEDMEKFANSSVPHARLKRFGMFLSLWTGAGFMAYIGKYL